VPAICTLWRHRKSCSRKGNDCNQRLRRSAGTNAATTNRLSYLAAPSLAEHKRRAPTKADAAIRRECEDTGSAYVPTTGAYTPQFPEGEETMLGGHTME